MLDSQQNQVVPSHSSQILSLSITPSLYISFPYRILLLSISVHLNSSVSVTSRSYRDDSVTVEALKLARMMNQWICGVLLLLILVKVNGISSPVNITILESARAKGAVCLDGTAPAYHLDKGYGVGASNWLVFLQGGGWCSNVTDCKNRTRDYSGSSFHMNKTQDFKGILDSDSTFSPYFYNWNRVYVMYCDGASFTGDVEEVDPATNLHFRGARIFKAIVDDLLVKGMRDADRVVLAGCSAGGLGVILNCNSFAGMLPSRSIKVKCVADAGFFINIKDVSGQTRFEDFYDEVVSLHGSVKILPEACTSKMKATLCFFPQNVVDQIQTPVFFVNAAYDSWQLSHMYATGDSWTNCTKNLANCSALQMKDIQHFHEEFLTAFKTAATSTSRGTGYFINNCHSHCQTGHREAWFQPDSPKINGTAVAKAVGQWVYDLRSFEMYGLPYPHDKTCEFGDI